MTQPPTLSGKGMSLAVLGVVARERVVLRAEAPLLLVSLEAAVAQVAMGRAATTLDRSCCLVVPAGARATVSTMSPASRVAVLTIHEPLLGAFVRAHRRLGVDRARLEEWLTRGAQLPRTLWVHEIVHRYVFERVALGEHTSAAARFLEVEILKEMYFLFRDAAEGAERVAAVRRYSAVVERALAHIEAHLFDLAATGALASQVGTSGSTLLRAFRREVGCTPGAYWRDRRLDEALALLRSGRHAVAEVARRVGYDEPTAFGLAFRKRFAAPPSSFLPRRPARAAPT